MPAHQRVKTKNTNEPTKNIALNKGATESNVVISLLHYVIIPTALMTLTPFSIIFIWFICFHCHGSYQQFGHYLFYNNSDVITGVMSVLRHSNLVTPFSISVVFGFAAWSVATMILVPGKKFHGPTTPKGNIPVYYDNGFYCYLVTMAALAITSFYYDVTIIYDKFDEIMATLCLFGLSFCLLLHFKGRFYPSTTDSGSSGYFIFDYYWGMELYPRIFGLDVKTFTNCRFGMTSWAVLVVIFAIKSFHLHGFVTSMLVSSLLQLAYFTKFFWWERGYMSTIDIMDDRAGFYLCWGCLVFIPGFFASVSLYLVTHPINLGTSLTAAIFAAGLLCLTLTYMTDWQKQKARDNNGECIIWGKKARFIKVQYQLETGETRNSILLLSGFWGMARHFNYLPELALTFCWTLPCLFEHVFPYSNFIVLAIIIIHRLHRDDEKCSNKYGKYWQEYKKQVPYRVIPGIF